MFRLIISDFFISLFSSAILFFLLKVLGFDKDVSYIISFVLFSLIFLLSLIFSFYLQKIKQKIIFLNAEIEKLKKFDEVTDVYNRNFLFENLKNYFEISKNEDIPLSFILIHIDDLKKFDFKKVNFVLKNVSEVLKLNAKEMDIIGRYSIDEFLIATFLNKKEALEFASKLHNELQKINIQVSIGVANRSNFDSINDLLRKTQEAVYLAQVKGGNRVDVLEHFLLIE